jgi:phage I-like protein
MTKRHRGRPVLLSQGTDPPVEFRLFVMGTVATDKGTFYLTPEDGQACVADHRAYGNDLSIDFGHGVFQEAEVPQRAAGWIKGIELRADGLWAVGVSWTELAAGMLRAREQRYFSPAFETDKAGHIRKILNVALTLAPATHNLQPLVASRLGGSRKATSMKLKKCSADDVAAMAEEMAKLAGDDKDLKALAEKMKALAEGGEESDDDEKDDEEEKTSEDDDKTEKTSQDDEGKTEATSILALARQLTGKTSKGEIAGVLLAYKESAGKVEKLAKRVAELEGSSRKEEVEKLVTAASRAGKLTPAMRTQAVKLGNVDIDMLKGWLSALPKIVAMTDGKSDTVDQPETETAVLSTEQQQILSRAGISDPTAFQAFLATRRG